MNANGKTPTDDARGFLFLKFASIRGLKKSKSGCLGPKDAYKRPGIGRCTARGRALSPLHMNFGGQEMIVVFLVVLLLFGAKKLPELARGLGKSMGEFKKAREEFEHEITRSEDEVRIKEAAGKEAHDKA